MPSKTMRLLTATTLSLALSLSQVLAAPSMQGASARPTSAVAEACADINRADADFAACANAIEARIAGDADLMKTLSDDAKNKRGDTARPVLEKIGVPASQLRNVHIALTGASPTAGERIKDISVTISCCPLTITIVIRL